MTTRPSLPPLEEEIQKEIAHLTAHRTEMIEGRLERVLSEVPYVDTASLLEGLTAFHRERMERIPSATQYPEAKPWVERVRTRDREIQQRTGLSDREMAVIRSLPEYLAFRGFCRAKPAKVERCRVAYCPETDQGELHIKNVDDPATYWVPEPPISGGRRPRPPARYLVWDGVGSGLHEDDEPPELFPLPIPRMCLAHCDDVPGAIAFVTRYRYFWGWSNVVLHDAQKRSVAIEKCSFNFIEVFPPDATGRSWVSGMVCRDPNSPQGQYQARKRREHRARFGLSMSDGPDLVFWDVCARLERMLADFLTSRAHIRLEEIVRLFTTPWPDGLCKTGVKLHPAMAQVAYTLKTVATVSDAKGCTLYRWQRGPKPDLSWPERPEVARFSWE